MSTFVVLATGESLTGEQVEFVRQKRAQGICKAIAVSDAYKLAPWADALVSNDSAWWREHKDALKFVGRKFCGGAYQQLERLSADGNFSGGTNSGLQGMRAAQLMGATRILLLGFDMHGTHFFGKHQAPLRNTTANRFKVHIAQFRKWRGCPVINCSPGSALDQFPRADLFEVLQYSDGYISSISGDVRSDREEVHRDYVEDGCREVEGTLQ